MRFRPLPLLLLAACATPAPDTAGSAAPLVGADWWATVQGNLDRELTTLRVSPDGALVADLPRAATAVRFDRVGMSADGGLSIGLLEWGREGALVAAPEREPWTEGGTRAQYDRAGAIEWWEVRVDGVEVGWDLDRAPAGEGELTFRLGVAGASIVQDPVGIALVEADLQRWEVSDVVAVDATGRGLPAGLRVEEGTLVAWVDDAEGVYPITVDPVITTASSTLSGATAGMYFGYSVAGAGDVNADGYGDVIVGAYQYSGGTGRAYVYLGSASGVSTSVGTTLSTGTANGHFGISVSSAGDVTNDGYDDVLVGEEGQNKAWIYWGSSRGVGTSGVSVAGDAGSANFGRAVAGGGDVNGDGYGDIVVGDSGFNGSKGRMYVFHGRRGGIDSTVASAWEGASLGMELGASVAIAGDVNNDGYSDVIAGAPSASSGAGAAYVHHGSSSGVSTSATTTLGGRAGSGAGGAVAGGCDLNGDGYDDVIVGSPDDSSGSGYAASFAGSASGVSTSTLRAWSAPSSGAFGTSVACLGDADQDGYADVAIGAPGVSGGGAVYIYHGTSGGPRSTAGETLTSSTASAFGTSVAAAGDVNGDGSADVLVGDYGVSSSAGKAYVFHGDVDADLDGYTSIDDCDDSNAGVHPGATETPGDNVDQDCDGSETCYVDADNDGYRASGFSTVASADTDCNDSGEALSTDSTNDCDDTRSTVNPGVSETISNSRDDDCDGRETCYDDSDDDGYRTGSTVYSTDLDCTDSGEATSTDPANDCDDTRATVNPGETEGIDDGVDQDCDGNEDCYTDADNDGYRPDATSVTSSADLDCNDAREAKASDPSGDCNDASSAVHPGATETTGDGTDQDCDGVEVCYADADRDGYRTSGTVRSADGDCSDAGEALSSATSGDCDDDDRAVNPGATEVVGDGVDQDCNDRELCYVDYDNDNYRPDSTSTVASSDLDCTDSGEDSGGSPTGDCDDRDADANPGETEVVGDNTDNDCDGQEYCYVDADDDAYRTDATVASADSDCTDAGEGTAANVSGDCDDGNPAVHPDATELAADGLDQDCDGTERCYIDADADGFRPDGVTTVSSADLDCTDAGETDGTGPTGDCDDTDAAVNPGAADLPDDGMDQDCDNVDDCYTDDDADGFRTDASSPGNDLDCADAGEAPESQTAGDCDDADPNVHPGTTEVPADRVDQDCDGTELCYVDVDADGYRPDDTTTVVSDDVTCDGKGEANDDARTGDCDDTDPLANPGAEEIPGDGIDEDCNGGELCWEDLDSDGYHSDTSIRSEDADCDDTGEVTDALPGGDCDDGNAGVNPGATEVCDGYDDDCDGSSDGDDAIGAVDWARDADGDGYTDPNDTAPGCEPPEGYRSPSSAPDCDDADAGIYPGAEEVLDDGIDNDCDGSTDEMQNVDDTGTVKDESGCGCASGGEPAGGLAALVLAGLALRRRRA